MKSSNAVIDNVVALPRPRKFTRAESEFLPAALEIIDSPASPAGRAIALSIIAFLAAAIVWASYGKVDIIATAEGRVIPSGKSKTIQPFETGVVRRIAVADGAAVKAGDVLIELDPTSDAADENRSSFDLAEDRLDIARLHALLEGKLEAFAPPGEIEPRLVNMAKHQMEAQSAEHQAKIDSFDRQIAQKLAEGREIKAAIEKVQMDIPLLTEQRDIRQALLQNQYGSRLAYLQMQQQLVDSEHDLESQRQKREEIAQALSSLDRQKAEASAEYRKGLFNDLAKAEIAATEHSEDIRKASLKRELRTLRAPVDGTVQQLAVHTIGGVVTPAEQLMVIVPRETGLEVEAHLPNKDVGFVQPGQEVAIKVETFTFTRYGLLHGKVLELSRDSVAPHDSTESDADARKNSDVSKSEEERQANQPSYIAHISLDSNYMQTEAGPVVLQPGMAITGEIKTGRRTVLSYLLSPLSRLKQESLRER